MVLKQITDLGEIIRVDENWIKLAMDHVYRLDLVSEAFRILLS